MKYTFLRDIYLLKCNIWSNFYIKKINSRFKSEVRHLTRYGQTMHTSPKDYKQLLTEDRMTIASLRQQNFSIRRFAEVLERSPATVSRELKRNSDAGVYASVSA